MIEHIILCPSTWDEVDHQLSSARNNVYRSCKLRTHSGLRISNDHTLDSCQFSWYLFCNSKLDALSAACPSAFTAVLCCFPSMGRQHNIGHTECAGKPRRPTYWEQQSLLSTLIVQSLYVCVLWHLSSQCTVFWTITRREIVAVDWITMSGQCSVCGKRYPSGCLWSSCFPLSSFDDEVYSHDEENGECSASYDNSFLNILVFSSLMGNMLYVKQSTNTYVKALPINGSSFVMILPLNICAE